MKKILSLLTAAILTSSSVSSATAFTTNKITKISTISTTKKLQDHPKGSEWIHTISASINHDTSAYGSFAAIGNVVLRMYVTKDNISWASGGFLHWNHFFSNLYKHIGIYHPEVGYSAGKATSYGGAGGDYTGYLFDKNVLNKTDGWSTYSIFSKAYWSSLDFMDLIDDDDANGVQGGLHGTYVDTLLQIAKGVPADNTGISFQITYHLDTKDRSYQIINLKTIAYY